MTRVFAPGVFDVFHIGHLNFLLAASRLGDELIVAVQEDRAVEKQKNVELVNPLPERVALIEQLRFVSEVVSYSEIFQGPLLDALRIDVFACGKDYGHDPRYPDQQRTLEYCTEHGIEIAHIPRTEHVSSTAVRAKLKCFWSSRAATEANNPSGVTTLGSFNGDQEKAREQTAREVAIIAGIARKHEATSLLDLGCGDGRHLTEVAGLFERITGVDYAEELISIANRKLGDIAPHVQLHTADVTEYRTTTTFDVILLSGITPCLDDPQFDRLLENVSGHAHGSSRLLVRTSISMGKRINLVNFFSPELGSTYTAYYRTKNETIRTIEQHGWTLEHDDLLYQHRPDTAVWWLEFRRRT